jgi:hypothetical protein
MTVDMASHAAASRLQLISRDGGLQSALADGDEATLAGFEWRPAADGSCASK